MQVHTPLRGFLLQDPDLSLANLASVPETPTALSSDYSAADPRPGMAVASDPLSTCTIRAHNAQDADLVVTTLRPGLPKIDGSGFVYREDTEAAASVRGWNEPHTLSGFYPIQVDTSEEWQDAQLVTDPDTGDVVCIASDIVGGTTISAWTWDAKTRVWGSQVEVASLAGADISCAVRLRATGRIVVFYGDKSALDVFASYSDDNGATWAQYGRDEGLGFGFRLNSNTSRMRVIEDRNGVLFALLTDSTGDFETYASLDGGHEFEALESSGSALGIRHDMFPLSTGQIAIVYRENTSNDGHLIILDDAYDSLAAKIASPSYEFSSSITIDHICGCTDYDGISYVYLVESNTDEVSVFRSLDGGALWSQYTERALSAALASHAPATDFRWRPTSAAPSGGEIVVVGTSLNASTSPSEDGSLLSFMFGGWDTIEFGGSYLGRTTRGSWAARSSFPTAATFIPTDTIDSYGWTVTGTGHTYGAGTNGTWQFASGGTAVYADETFSDPGASNPKAFFFAVRMMSGATYTNIMRIQRGAFGISIQANTAGFRCIDYHASAVFGSTVTESMTGTMLFMVHFADRDTVTVWYKRPGAATWTIAAQKNGLTSGALVTNPVRFGVLDNTLTSTVRIGWFALSEADVFSTRTGNPPYFDDLSWGKAIGQFPYPVRDQGGDRMLYLSAAGGYNRHNEQWTIAAAYDHGIAEVFSEGSPGPDARWRSVDTSEQRLLWDLTGDARNGRLGHSPLIGLCLVGTNFRTATLSYLRSGSSSPVDLGTWDATLESGLSFDRGTAAGEILRPLAASGKAAGYYWPAGFLEGGTAVLDPSGTPKYRRIRWNSAGGWFPGSPFPPEIELDGIDGTELTTGDVDIYMPGGVLLLSTRSPIDYRRLQLKIPSQDTAEGYFELGNLIGGGVLVPGRQWSRGYSIRIRSRVVTEEDDQGVLWPDRRGVAVREATVAWQDAGDTSKLWRGPDVPYLAPQGGAGVVGRQDVPWALEAMERLTRGGALPVVFLPDCGGPSGTMIVDPRAWLYGIKQGDPQYNHVLGDDIRSPVFRNESLTIREQPWTRWVQP